jgi:hypothetical protein
MLEKFRVVFFWVLLLSLLSSVLVFLILGKTTEAAVLAVTGILVAVLLRSGPAIEELKLWGLSVRLRRAIEEAEATISDLRLLAIALSRPIVSQLAMHGSLMEHITFGSLYDHQQQIDTALDRIGVSAADRNEVMSLWRRQAQRKLSALILYELPGLEKDAFDNFYANRTTYPAPDEYTRFLAELDLLDEERRRLIEQYDLFMKTGKILEPEYVPSHVHGRRIDP